MGRTREELEERLAEIRAERVAAVPIFSAVEMLAPSENDNGRSNVIDVYFGMDERRAHELYAEASKLDEDMTRLDEAEALYRESIRRWPTLADAYVNLGNVRFQRGDEHEAEMLYREAMAIDPDVAEASYNLGYLLLDKGDTRGAVEQLRRAVEKRPSFEDAHFNLAAAYEKLGERAQARPHWTRYLALDPHGEWAAVARQHLSGEIRKRWR